MEIRNLGSDLISIMMITTLGSLTRAREQEARPACGSASSECTRVKLLCDLGRGNDHLGSGYLPNSGKRS